MKSFKIARIAPEKLPVPPVMGGAVETCIYESTKNSKLDITIFSRPSNTNVPDSNIKFVGIKESFIDRLCNKIILRFSSKNPLRVLAKIHNVFMYALKVSMKLKNQYDIIHVDNDPNFVPLIRFFNKKSKIILHMHNDHLNANGLFRQRYANILKKTDAIFCVSDYIKNQIVMQYPQEASKCVTIYNGTNIDNFKTRKTNPKLIEKYDLKGNKVVLYVGRINEYKGVDYLIDAFKKCLTTNPKTKLLIVGSSWFKEGAKTKFIKNLEDKSADIIANVAFTGYLAGQELYDIYSLADIVVCPSIWQEPFGLVCIEAMASSKALIATRVGGIPEIIEDNKSGLLVDPKNSSEICAKLTYLLNNNSKRKLLGQNARTRVKDKFTWEICQKTLERRYELMMAGSVKL